MSFQLQTNILHTLREVSDQKLGVMEAFDYLVNMLSEEFDKQEQEIRKEYLDLETSSDTIGHEEIPDIRDYLPTNL